MFKSDGINYDNVRPKANLLSSKKINFHDKKDLIKNVKREKKYSFFKKIKLNFFSFMYFIFTFHFFQYFKSYIQKRN